MPVVETREYRAMALPLGIAETNKRFDTEFYVEGYATTFDDPYLLYEYDGIKVFEQISRNALDGADISDVIMQYDHAGKVLARISNKTLGITPDQKGLFIYADLSKSRAAQDMHEEIKNQLITRMSWAFVVAKDSYDRTTRTRTIEKIKKVYDVSAVSLPANQGTEIAARSYAQGRLEAERRETMERRIQILLLKTKLEV
jgi:HK97 family phage prohead protease